MGQAWNAPALRSTVRLIARRADRSKMLAHFYVEDVSSVPWARLRAAGLQGVVFEYVFTHA